MTAISYLIEVVVARPAAEIQRPAAPGRRPFSDVSHYVFREPDGPDPHPVAPRPRKIAGGSGGYFPPTFLPFRIKAMVPGRKRRCAAATPASCAPTPAACRARPR